MAVEILRVCSILLFTQRERGAALEFLESIVLLSYLYLLGPNYSRDEEVR